MGEHHFGNFTLGILDLLMNNTGEFVISSLARTQTVLGGIQVVSCAATPLTLRVASQVVSCAARPLTLRVASGYRGGVFLN